MREAAGAGVDAAAQDSRMPVVLGFDAGDREHAPAGASSTTLGQAAEDTTPVLVLYRAPWTAFLDDRSGEDARAAADWLQEWIAFHRDVLVLHRRFPQRVMLVNAGKLGNGTRLPAHLQELGFSRGTDPEADPEPAGAAAVGAETDGALQSLLASAMDSACPDAWSVYEELESRAQLLGREPEFRGIDGIADLSDAGALLVGFANLRAGIARALERARAVPPPEPPSNELHQENELLSLHLAQVLEELQFHSERGRQLDALLREAGDVSEAARLLISELRGGERAPD